jgi:hydrophobe/amphiphile efflux-3 (HAE3) family protein
MEKFISRIVRLRWVIVIVVAALTLFFGFQLKNIKVNSDILSSLPDNDDTGVLYKQIGKEFGGNEIGMIVLETDDIFKTDVLDHVRQITDSLMIMPGVTGVTSLTNILDIKSSEWGIEIGKLVDEYELPETQEELESLRQYVFSKEMYKGTIVSDDGTATVILFNVLPEVNKLKIAGNIKTRITTMDLPETLYFGGLPFLLSDITDILLSDMVWLISIVFVVIALILLISFRNLRGMLLPLLTAGITVVWTLGIMAISGIEITIITNFMPVVLIAIGSAYTIHILNSIDLSTLEDRKNALITAVSHTIMPVFLASATTAVGFVSFIFGAYLTMIKDFGIATAIGILIALLLSIIFVPAFISALSMYRRKSLTTKSASGILADKVLHPLINLLFHHPKRVLIAWSIFLILGIGGIFMIKTSVNITEYFKKDNPVRISEDLMQRKFGGSLPVYVQFEGDIREPDVLKMMMKTKEFMEEDPNITSAQSVADLVAQMNDAMGEGNRIPDEKAKIEQLWFLLDGQDVMAQLVSDDLHKAIIQSKFASIETDEISAFTDKMNDFIRENQMENCTIRFTGIPPLYVKLNDSLIKSQYSSLIIAVFLVLIIVAAIMRSVPKGIYTTIPIIATIILLLGFMGFTGTPLDIATVLVGSIALGIGIDYSIHVISGFNTFYNTYGDTKKAIEETILNKGKAVIVNVTSVAAGFLVLMKAQIVPIQNFGLMIAVSMVASGIGALTLLPVILILANRRRDIKNQQTLP